MEPHERSDAGTDRNDGVVKPAAGDLGFPGGNLAAPRCYLASICTASPVVCKQVV